MSSDSNVERIHAAWLVEMSKGRGERQANNLDAAFTHFERAHILGQRFTVLHVRSHWEMFRIAWRRKDVPEFVGQVSRMVAATLFSRIWVPIGNTGGANVSAFKPMPIPEDLAAILNESSKSK
jgi:hypothetical protein